jgi:hypothetical protein
MTASTNTDIAGQVKLAAEVFVYGCLLEYYTIQKVR